MGNVERALDVAAIRILTFSVEHLAVMLVVVEVDCAVECQKDDLRSLFRVRTREREEKDIKLCRPGIYVLYTYICIL